MLYGILATILLIYVLLLILWPKGNIIQETVSLLPFWLRLFMASRAGINVSRHTYGAHARQYYLYVEPESLVGTPKKAIVYLHGGGWQFGAPEYFKANAKVFTDQGYVVFLPSYRRIPRFNYDDLREDLDAMLLRIRQQLVAQEWPNLPLVLGGMSAGGNLAALAFYDRQRWSTLGLPPHLFAGAFFCGAPLDLERMVPSWVLRKYAGERDGDRFRAASPITYLADGACLPVLIVHGEKDGMVAFANAQSFVAKRQQCHPKAITFHRIPDGTHLDASKWAFRNDPVRQAILAWLEALP